MRRLFSIIALFVLLPALASATTYYVSSSSGSDANSGTSSTAAWQTIAHVNAQTFQPGDFILFKRGDAWNESLVPPSSGTSASPIAFDAYGTGAPPNLTGYYPVPSSEWIFIGSNAWKAPLPSTYSTVNFCLFGSIWGQKVSAVSTNLTAQWDFYFANGYVYVYSQGNPALYYNEPIVPMALSNVPVIDVNNQTWLTFQHFLVNWFDDEGVYVQGTSDHLVFANMEADSLIPQGTQPLGFYVNETSPGPGDIKIYNSEAHLNYDGFRFDGTATAIAMVNDKGYANRDGALVDNTGAVSYSYCHFYASSLAVAGSTDVEWTSGPGPNAGPGNIPQDTAPAVQVYQRYPAMVTLTVDDAGMTPGADTYYADQVVPIAQTAGIPVGAAITVGYPLAQTLIPEFQSWIDSGLDVTAHSISHTYYTNTDAIDLQYIGSGSAATLSISGNIFTISVTGAPDSVTYNLAQGQPQGTMLALAQALAATGKYTYSFLTPCQGPYGTGCSAYTAAALLSQDLANVSGQDVKTSVYHAQLNVTRLTTDEITLSRQWMTTNLTGLPSTPVYVYPGGYETTTMQGITAGIPYSGARGALKEDLGVKDTYADGFNAQNITSFGVNPTWMGITPASLNQKIDALVWKESVWGVPWGIFWHLNELTQDDPIGGTEITDLINDFKNSGATVKTNTSLVSWLLTGTQENGADGTDYYKIPATSMTLDFRPTENSPVVDAGENLGPAYELDINGVNQNSYGSGWEIGAHVLEAYSSYGEGSGSGEFTIGSLPQAPAELPQLWVNNNEGNSAYQYELSLPSTWLTAAPSGCTFHTPYWTGSPTQAGLQSAVNDMEACRTAMGYGIALDIPPALYTTSSVNGLVIPQTNSATSTNFLVLRSTNDALLPNGQTVCAHGIQDNLASLTDIGLDNPACSGSGMYYQLGTTITNITAGAFTLANGTVTNTSAYDDVQSMWTAECSGLNCSALTFCNASGTAVSPTCSTNIGPDHWLIEDMEVRMNAGNTGDANVISMSAGGAGVPTALSQFPTHIHLRKIWEHGDWTSLAAGANKISAGIQFSCSYCSLLDSQFSQNLRPGAEGHIAYTEGPGPYKIDHNWLEGQSSSIFPGGNSTAPNMAGFVPFQDVELRRNRMTFPSSWLGQMTVPSGNANWSGQSLVRKNCMEFKEAERVVRDGNICENVDNSGGQNGTVAVINVRQTSGTGANGSNYQATINDITYTNEIDRNACEGLEIAGRSGPLGNGGGVSYPLRRMLVGNDLEYNISKPSNPGCGGSQFGLQMSASGQSWQGTVTGNGTTATFVATCSVDGGDCPSGPPSIGFQVMNMNAGDPVWVSGCTSVPAFNAATHTIDGMAVPLGIGPLLSAGSAAWTGSFNSAGVTVSWPSTVTGTDSSGNCTVWNTQGAPFGVIVNHHTLVTDANQAVYPVNSPPSNGPNFQLNHIFTNSILLNSGAGSAGWYTSIVGEGNPTEIWGYDYTSLTAGFNVWPSRTASKYNDYGNAPGSPLPGGVCTSTGCNPPTTSYFPATSYCSGSAPTSACIGFSGAMSASAMPLTLNDYHGYELIAGSTFKAGGSGEASDGTDMGASIPAIDAAETLNAYVCGSSCGTGPYEDTNPATIPFTMFGFTENGTQASNFPTVTYNSQRFWDSPPLQWPSINTAPGAFDFSNLDGNLSQAYSHGINAAFYTLARTPTWASSNPGDTSCAYTGAGSGNGNGECDPPSDLNSDGSGTNATWKAWISALAQHVNAPGYCTGTGATHACIKYWEIWNEPDTEANSSGRYWAGTFAQLARLTEDANCIITGRGVIHESGNGTATPCTASAIDPTAKIVMSSGHADQPALTFAQNQLYCNNITGIPAGELPCPNPANAIASAIDIVNFHMKPGNETGTTCPAPTPCTPESAMQMYVANIHGILQANELAKPLWDGEAAYSTAGFTGAYTDADMAASFMPRFYLINWSLGISAMAWYTWDVLTDEPSEVQTAYQQAYSWLSNASLYSPCSASGTVWSCGIVKSGVPYLIMWDTSQSCSGGSCTTGNQPVSSQWTQYQDMTTASTPASIAGHVVPLGIKPVIMH